MTFLLDTSALLVLFRSEPGADQVLALFDDPKNDLLLCAVSMAKFGRKLRELGQKQDDVERTVALHLPLFTRVAEVDTAVALASLRLADSITLRLPLADALIAAAALSHGACLVHKNGHMAAIPSDVLTTMNLACP